MESGLRKSLEEFSLQAKKEAGCLSPEQAAKLPPSREALLRQTAAERGGPLRAEQEIFRIQKEKQRIMDELKGCLRSLEQAGSKPEIGPGRRLVVCQEGKYYQQMQGGEIGDEISLGELMTDADWGINYQLDPETVPRPVRKRFLVEQAKDQLRRLADEQIIINQITGKIDSKLSKAYKEVLSNRREKRAPMGMVAEAMVRNFLAKLAIDFPAASFQVEKADVYQDVEQKIDFIIHRRRHHRGVNVAAVDEPEDKGIQFTVNQTKEHLDRKARQLERVSGQLTGQKDKNDIVLVSLPLGKFTKAYQEWEMMQKPSGGPDKLWPAEVKEEIFRQIMKGFLAPEEMDEQWNIVSGRAEVSMAA